MVQDIEEHLFQKKKEKKKKTIFKKRKKKDCARIDLSFDLLFISVPGGERTLGKKKLEKSK